MSAMHSDTQSRHSSVGEPGQAWRALAIIAAILAIEACVVGWFFGGWLLKIPGKKIAAIALVGMVGGMWSHIAQHRAEYRSARVSWPLIAGQLLSFAGVFAALGMLINGSPRLALDDWRATLAIALPAVVCAACSLTAIAPRRALAQSLVGLAALSTALAVVAWNIGNLTEGFWNYTGDTTIRLVEFLLRPFAGGPIVRPEPFIIGTDAFRVRIAPGCSGFHGIGLITALLVGYFWWFRGLHRFPQSLLLLPVGIALVWLANVVRITSLILVGIWISPEIAVDGFHSTAGWIAFLTVGLGIIWTASRMPFFTLTQAPPIDATEDTALLAVDHRAIAAGVDVEYPANTPAVACLLPFLALTAVTMPIAEELFFRGFVIRRCISEDTESVPEGQFSWFSFLASSAAFGFLHGDAWLAGIVAGMLFAAALYGRRRLCDAVVAHATTNALLSGYVLATGSWSQWG